MIRPCSRDYLNIAGRAAVVHIQMWTCKCSHVTSQISRFKEMGWERYEDHFCESGLRYVSMVYSQFSSFKALVIHQNSVIILPSYTALSLCTLSKSGDSHQDQGILIHIGHPCNVFLQKFHYCSVWRDAYTFTTYDQCQLELKKQPLTLKAVFFCMK